MIAGEFLSYVVLIHLVKAVGRIVELSLPTHGVEGTTGFGHILVATHGKNQLRTTHPHRSETERFVLVHNGVIENYILNNRKNIAGFPTSRQTDILK